MKVQQIDRKLHAKSSWNYTCIMALFILPYKCGHQGMMTNNDGNAANNTSIKVKGKIPRIQQKLTVLLINFVLQYQ